MGCLATTCQSSQWFIDFFICHIKKGNIFLSPSHLHEVAFGTLLGDMKKDEEKEKKRKKRKLPVLILGSMMDGRKIDIYHECFTFLHLLENSKGIWDLPSLPILSLSPFCTGSLSLAEAVTDVHRLIIPDKRSDFCPREQNYIILLQCIVLLLLFHLKQ